MQRQQPPSLFSCAVRATLAALAVMMPTSPVLAADILRKSGGTTTSGATSGTGVSTSAQVPAGTASQRESLVRAAQAKNDILRMQQAARQAAVNSTQTTYGLTDSSGKPIANSQFVDGLVTGTEDANSTLPGLKVAKDNKGQLILWSGASQPTTDASNTNVTITQTNQQAYLQWDTFNLGKNTTLTYNQSLGGATASEWIAFNYVRDKTANPSQILGTIKTVGTDGTTATGGQVYVLNANGIIFGASSQVNTHALVASSLPINTNLLQSGLLNNSSNQFLFTGLKTTAFDPSVAVAGIAPVQTPFASDGSGKTSVSYKYGSILVDTGASLSAPSSSDHVGGRIMLIGPNVTNQGSIATPDGQTILAAGLQVGFSTSSSDASLRGLYTYVGTVSDGGLNSGGIVTNDESASIDAPRGNITIAGMTVNQLGYVSSSTSVSYNGRIDLVASYGALSDEGNSTQELPFFFTSTGAVNFGANSVTQILPEWGSTDRVVGSQLALRSLINVQAGNISFAGASGTQRGAVLVAPSADVVLDAGIWTFTQGGIDPATGGITKGAGTKVNDETFVYTAGHGINIGDNAIIDVSGSRGGDGFDFAASSVTENIIAVELRGPELANSPLQRTGALRGQTIYVDVRQKGTYNGQSWIGTPLADTHGYVGLIQRTVGELTTDGGSVSLNAGGAVDLASSSKIDVSGGWTSYAGAYVQTTKVLQGGHVIDISKATPDQIYDGIYTGTSTVSDAKWNLTRTFVTNPALGNYENGYYQGGNGGGIAITAPAMSLSGQLEGKTYAGFRQRNPYINTDPTTIGASSPLKSVEDAGFDLNVWQLDGRPGLSSLALTFSTQYVVGKSIYSYLPNPPDIYIAPRNTNVLAKDVLLPYDLIDQNAKASDYVGAKDYAGFGNVTINDGADNNNSAASLLDASKVLFGSIYVKPSPDGGITMAPGAALVMTASNIHVEEGISAPGGSLNFTAVDLGNLGTSYDATLHVAPDYNQARGNFSLLNGASLNVAGTIVDNRNTTTAVDQLTPYYTTGGKVTIHSLDLTIAKGGIVDVDGGAVISATGKVSYAAAGSIALYAGSDPSSTGLYGGTLDIPGLDQTTLDWNKIPFQGYSGLKGGTLTLQAPLVRIFDVKSGDLPATPADETLDLSSKFFSEGGFSSFNIQALGGSQIGANGKVVLDKYNQPLYYTALYIANGTQIVPKLLKVWLDPKSDTYGRPYQGDLNYENSPVSLSFSAVGERLPTNSDTNWSAKIGRGDIVMAAGSVILTDPQTDSSKGVSITGETVAIYGKIVAPGGTITVSSGDSTDSDKLFAGSNGLAVPTVYLAPGSELSTQGATVLTADYRGRLPNDPNYVRTGSALSGGTINVTGNIVAAGNLVDANGNNIPGAILNVSGSHDVLYYPSAVANGVSGANGSLGGLSVVPAFEAGNAGSISLKGVQELFVDATLEANVDSSTAVGGSLKVSSKRKDNNPVAVQLSVKAAGPTVPSKYYSNNPMVIGQAVTGADGNPLDNWGHFSVDRLTNSGIASLTLSGVLGFDGAVTISVPKSLRLGDKGIIFANDVVNLTAPYINMGEDYVAPSLTAVSPFNDLAVPLTNTVTGTLNITASGSAETAGLIDIGNLSLQGVAKANLVAANGDIRGYGTLDILGDISLTAAQVYPATAEIFSIAAYDNPTNLHQGSVSIHASGSRQLPLSVGGILNIFASKIDQAGTLVAPLGQINLGLDGSGNIVSSGSDPLTQNPFPVTQTVTIESGSVTSVSGQLVDPTTGKSISLPYGLDLNGKQWIDPAGNDITNGGLPGKAINIFGASITMNSQALIDTSGGGDLYSYNFVSGVGGNRDILSATSTSFAVLPWYQAGYAPYAGFDKDTVNATNLGGDLGYVSLDSNGNSRLSVGDKIYIDLNNGQGAKSYTLLPARYALLPGAYLVTPMSSGATPPAAANQQADGSTIVAGYRYNTFAPSRSLYAEYEVASQAVVANRAQYTTYSANEFFTANATASGQTAPRLPQDGGQMEIVATTSLVMQGKVAAAAASGGRGGFIDISSPRSIEINDTGLDATGSGATDKLYLSADSLANFSAGSLLVGGYRTAGSDGLTVNVTTSDLKVSNDSTHPLEGSDLILVSNGQLTLSDGAVVKSMAQTSGSADAVAIKDSVALQTTSGGANTMTFARGGTAISFPQGTLANNKITLKGTGGVIVKSDGQTQTVSAGVPFTLTAGSTLTLNGAGQIVATGTGGAIPLTFGDGAMIRVSSFDVAGTSRSNVSTVSYPTVQLGKGVVVNGASVTIDSTSQLSFDPSATISGKNVAIDGGQISLLLGDKATATNAAAGSLVLTATALSSLGANAKNLSFLSYSSIDTYGTGQVGNPALQQLALHTGEIRGFGASTDTVSIKAQTILVDNSANAIGAGVITSGQTQGSPASLTLDASQKLILGTNRVAIDQYSAVNLISEGQVYAEDSGVLVLSGKSNLTITTPLFAAKAGSDQTISTGGTLGLVSPSSGLGLSDGSGLGAKLTLSGSSVTLNTHIDLPSGSLTVNSTGDANTGGIELGSDCAVSVAGTARTFNDAKRYTNAGQVALNTANGSVVVDTGASIDLSAQAAAGSAGTLSISAPNGTLKIASGTVNGTTTPTFNASHGLGGSFSLDVANLSLPDGTATTSLQSLENVLSTGNFKSSQTIRVRTGDVLVDGNITAHAFDLSTDQGAIEVTGAGVIDASSASTGYNAGGSISLAARGSVTLDAGSLLSVQAENYDANNKAGNISLETRGGETITVDQSGSYIYNYDNSKVIDIKPGARFDLSVVNNLAYSLDISGKSSVVIPVGGVGVYFPDGTPGDDKVAFTGNGTIRAADGTNISFTATASNPFATILSLGSTVTMDSGGTVLFASGTGGSIRFNVPEKLPGNTKLTLAYVTDLSGYTLPGELHLRAPQVANASGDPFGDVLINPIGASFLNRSTTQKSDLNIVVEGYRVFDLTHVGGQMVVDYNGTSSQPLGGDISDPSVNLGWSVEDAGASFAGGVLSDGTPVPGNAGAIKTRLFGSNGSLKSLTHVRPGAEIVNQNGDLTLNSVWDFAAGSNDSTSATYPATFDATGDPASANSWTDISAMPYRFGPKVSQVEPGYLTLRAQKDVVFGGDSTTGSVGTLTDGFGGYDGSIYDNSLWQAVMLPTGTQSWSYTLVAGADLNSASRSAVAANSAGSLLLGKGASALATSVSTADSKESLISANYQTIRTGTGNIDIHAAGNVWILNNLATIYTAGTQDAPLANFDLPAGDYGGYGDVFPAQYSWGGGDVTIAAKGDIAHLVTNSNGVLVADSSLELPINWLYRRGWIDPTTNGQFGSPQSNSVKDSTSWWVNYSNFFEGVGALGGGNVTLVAGGNISNIDAVVPTNERTTKQVLLSDGKTMDSLAADQPTLELGGGNLVVKAGKDIDGGVYYVERGSGVLTAGNDIHSNSTRAVLGQTYRTDSHYSALVNDPTIWLPTTLFLGDGSFDIKAGGDILLGPVVNPFLLPQGFAYDISYDGTFTYGRNANIGFFTRNYFSTYALGDSVDVGSLGGSVTLKERPDASANGAGLSGSLQDWFNQVIMDHILGSGAKTSVAEVSQPWLLVMEPDVTAFSVSSGLVPSNFSATAFGGDINLVGSLVLSPSPKGQVSILAEGAINGVQPNGLTSWQILSQNWGSSEINLSDADPARIPSTLAPLAVSHTVKSGGAADWVGSSADLLSQFRSLFGESGSFVGNYGSIQEKQNLHAAGILHLGDDQPVQLYATTGDISGLTLFAGKSARLISGNDITDIAVYIQNNSADDISTLIAGRDVIAYDPNSALRIQANNHFVLGIQNGSEPASGNPTAGDIQLGGMGSLEVLAGRNIDLGQNPHQNADGTSVGITSIGQSRNPYLPFEGADVVVAAGLGSLTKLSDGSVGLAASSLDFDTFISEALASINGSRYVAELAAADGLTVDVIQSVLTDASKDAREKRDQLALDLFYVVLRDAGRDRNNPDSPDYKTYGAGDSAIKALFAASAAGGSAAGDVTMATRLLETTSGGNIDLLTPNGQLTVGYSTDKQKPDQGVLTEHGGNINIFAKNNVSVGVSRIFTLRGGNEIIWSTAGNIAAGSGSKTLKTAPPTRVLIDPQSGDVQNDLAGLATGSGIGVLATLANVAPGDVDLIAPAGTIDAGDAGIRSSGHVNVAAAIIINAANIQSSAGTSGTPVVAAPNIGGITTAVNSSAGVASTANEAAKQQQKAATQSQEEIIPSIIQVEVLGYGGGDGDEQLSAAKSTSDQG